MNITSKSILYLAAGAAAACLLARYAMQKGLKSGAMSGDSERVSGVAALYGANVGQQQVTQAAIDANWADISKATASQPDWWI